MFFLPDAPPELSGCWTPPQELTRHLKALRVSREEEFLLMLPLGGAVRARWSGQQDLQLFGLTEIPRMKLMPVTLATAWPKGSHADELVVRATESGVERLIPLRCERSVAGTKPFTPNKIKRWLKLIRETCQQCGRPVPMILDSEPILVEEILQEAPAAHPIALHPDNWLLSVELELYTPREALLIVGPEGGFSPGELQWFQEKEVHRAGLIAPVLRIESAGPLGAGICQHWFQQIHSR